MAITHAKVSGIADGGDTDLVRPSDWNASHVGGVDVTATAENDMIVAGADPFAWAKKTLAQVITILRTALDSVYEALGATSTHAALTATHGAAFISGVTAGQYTGDSSANRAIPHGLGRTPKLVVINGPGGADNYGNNIGFLLTDRIYWVVGGTNSSIGMTAVGATNFYVGNATDYTSSCNLDTRVYYWRAFG